MYSTSTCCIHIAICSNAFVTCIVDFEPPNLFNFIVNFNVISHKYVHDLYVSICIDWSFIKTALIHECWHSMWFWRLLPLSTTSQSTPTKWSVGGVWRCGRRAGGSINRTPMAGSSGTAGQLHVPQGVDHRFLRSWLMISVVL